MPMKKKLCFITRIEKPLDELIHLVVSPSNQWSVDISGTLPGEGCWVLATRTVLESFSVSQERMSAWPTVIGAEHIVERVGELFKAQALSLLGFANKAGVILTGNEKIIHALKKSHKGILIQASDASVDGKLKLQYNARGCDMVIDQVFSREELSRALGKENSVHVWLNESAVAEAFLKSFRRFRAFDNLAV